MKPSPLLPLSEIRKKGFELLCEHLGVSDALRFIGQYELGHGDYTRERYSIFGKKTVKDIAREIRRTKTATAQTDPRR